MDHHQLSRCRGASTALDRSFARREMSECLLTANQCSAQKQWAKRGSSHLILMSSPKAFNANVCSNCHILVVPNCASTIAPGRSSPRNDVEECEHEHRSTRQFAG